MLLNPLEQVELYHFSDWQEDACSISTRFFGQVILIIQAVINLCTRVMLEEDNIHYHGVI